MNFVLPRGSSLGLYARKNAIPTLTLNDIRDVLSGYRNSMVAASAEASSRHSRSIVRLPVMILVPCHQNFEKFLPQEKILLLSKELFQKEGFLKLFVPLQTKLANLSSSLNHIHKFRLTFPSSVRWSLTVYFYHEKRGSRPTFHSQENSLDFLFSLCRFVIVFLFYFVADSDPFNELLLGARPLVPLPL